MLFSSSIFWVFFAIVVLLLETNTRLIGSVKFQNIILLIASYFFYGYWDWQFLSLIFLVSLQTYIFAKVIHQSRNFKKIALSVSVLINLGVLFYFKYANFFVSELFETFGVENNFTLENIILPVGISFYIFQSFTYVLDVYFEKIPPEKDPIKYFTFIAFFPQLVAGPIERASELLPQFNQLKKITLENFYVGLKIIIIGLFLKSFIADSIAPFTDQIFINYSNFNGGTLLLGAIGFTIQIYGDFAGYSLIAIGVAKIMNFELMKNFNTPYFSNSIQDFWTRWHISLSSFFRDYVYIPLGGSRLSKITTNRNLLVTFSVSGLWHGANWTFIFWGICHGVLLILQRILPVRLNKFIGWLLTMTLVLILWVMFRSESISDFMSYIQIILLNPGMPEVGKSILVIAMYYFVLDVILLVYSEKGPTWFRSLALETFTLAVMFVVVIGTIHDKSQNFIYFQF
jgi:D-alanyl-lipoteichoic acid acyltransferase DltB (MBOAT superfamily)